MHASIRQIKISPKFNHAVFGQNRHYVPANISHYMVECGDSVMADRGFTIADLLDRKGVNLQWISSLITTRRIAALRIHVERAISRVRIPGDIPNNNRRSNIFVY